MSRSRLPSAGPLLRPAWARIARTLAIGAFFLGPLVACGGGDATQVQGPEPYVRLGTVPSSVTSRVTTSFANPLAEEATITEVSNSGILGADPADLPAAVPANGSVVLGVLVLSPNQGLRQGTITLRFAGASLTEDVTYRFEVLGEVVPWEITPATLDFGTVDLGMSADLLVRFRNGSTMSPVTLTSAQFSREGFSVVGTPFPIALAPGEEGSLTLRFEPTTGGTHDGLADIGPLDLGGPARIPIQAAAPGTSAETIVDYGVQTFSGGFTQQLLVDVPANAISLTLEGLGVFGDVLGLGELIGPGGKVYENTSLTGAYIWFQGAEVFSTTVPNTDLPNVQLVPGGGRYLFRIHTLNGVSSTVRVRAIIESRTAAGVGEGVLDLNIWLADGIAVNAATAPGDTRLQAIIGRMNTILMAQGIRIGDIDYYNVVDPAFTDITSETEFFSLLRTTSGATATRLNLFFVRTALGGGVVGASATVSGPKRNGTRLSGVMSVYDAGLGTNTVGIIGAHEVGHFLGLFHTVEQTGSHDFIADTANCPANGTNMACPTAGGGLLLHWRALGGTTITNGQGLVLRAHPLLGPAPGGSPKPTPPARRPPPLTGAELRELDRLPDGWCASCGAVRKDGGATGR